MRAQRFWLLAWMLSWVFCTASLDVLHHHHGDVANQPHHTCLVCHIGFQPAQTAVAFQTSLPKARVFTAVNFVDTGTPRFLSAAPQPPIPRGPPASVLVVS